VSVGPCIADFAARSRKLIVEVDGGTHNDEARDARRTAWLAAQGHRVIRVTNGDVMRNLEGVMRFIGEALVSAPLPTLSPGGKGL